MQPEVNNVMKKTRKINRQHAVGKVCTGDPMNSVAEWFMHRSNVWAGGPIKYVKQVTCQFCWP
eukprot:10821486-Prorocentrum_lima.AAC.1